MAELTKQKCTTIEQKNPSLGNNETAIISEQPFLKSNSEETEKEKLNTARKKLLALEGRCLTETSKHPQNSSLVELEKKLITTENPRVDKTLFTKTLPPKSPTLHAKDKTYDSQNNSLKTSDAGNNVSINLISSSDEEIIEILYSDEKRPFLKPNKKSVNSENIQEKTVQKEIVLSDSENIPTKNNLNPSDSSKMSNIKRKEISSSVNTKDTKDKEDQYEMEILEALKDELNEANNQTNTPSDKFELPMFQPRTCKVKNMQEITKPGKPTENRKSDNLPNPLNVIQSGEEANQTQKKCFGNIMSNTAPPASKSSENVSKKHDETFKYKTNIPRLHTSSNIPTVPNPTFGRLDVPVNPYMPTPPYTGFDYPTKSNHLFSRIDSTINSNDPQFSSSVDVPITPNYPCINSDRPYTPKNPNVRPEDALFTASHPNMKSDKRTAADPRHFVENNKYDANRRRNEAQYNDIKLYNMKLHSGNKYFNNSDSYRNQREKNIYNNERREHYSREIMPSHVRHQKSEMSRHYDIDRPNSEFRRRSHDYENGFDYNTEIFNDGRIRRSCEQRAPSNGRTAFLNEKIQRAQSSPLNDDIRHRNQNRNLSPESRKLMDTNVNNYIQELTHINEHQRYQHPFEDCRRRAASMDRNLIRINPQDTSTICKFSDSNSSHMHPKSSPQPNYNTTKSITPQILHKKDERIENKTVKKTINEINPELKSFRRNCKKSKEQNYNIKEREQKKNSISRPSKDQPEKIILEPINQKVSESKDNDKTGNKKQKTSTSNSKINKYIIVKSNRIDKKCGNPKVKHPLARLSQTETKNVKRKYIMKKGKNRDTKIKKSKAKEVTRIRKENKGDVILKTIVLKTLKESWRHTSKNKHEEDTVSKSKKAKKAIPYSDSDSKTNKATKSHCSKSASDKLPENDTVKRLQKAITYSDSESEIIQATIGYCSGLSEKLPVKDNVIKTKKPKKAIVYSDSDSETIPAKSGLCSRSSYKLSAKDTVIKTKKPKKAIIYSDSDSETNEGTRGHCSRSSYKLPAKDTVNVKKGKKAKVFSKFNSKIKQAMKNDNSLEVTNGEYKSDQKTNSNQIIEPHTTSVLSEEENVLSLHLKHAQYCHEDLKSTASNQRDTVLKKCMEQSVPKRKILSGKDYKKSPYSNKKHVNIEKYVEKVARDNRPDVTEKSCIKTKTSQQVDSTYHFEPEQTKQGTNERDITDGCQKKSNDTNACTSTSERSTLHSDIVSLSTHCKDEISKEVIESSSQENGGSKCIEKCLFLVKNLLEDVPKSMFSAFIYDLCVNRDKEDIMQIIKCLNTLVSKTENGDSNSNAKKGELEVTSKKIKKDMGFACNVPIIEKASSKGVRELYGLVKQLEYWEDTSDFKINNVNQRLRPRSTIKVTYTSDTDSENEIKTSSLYDVKLKVKKKRGQSPKPKPDNSELTKELVHHENLNSLIDPICKSGPEPNEIIQNRPLQTTYYDKNLCRKATLESEVKLKSDRISEVENENITSEITSSEKNQAKNQAQSIISISDCSHFKVIQVNPKVKKYVCCINGTDNHFTTLLPPALLVHVEKKHPEIWDGYCFVCEKIVTVSQADHNFTNCLQHMLDNHNIDDFPVLFESEKSPADDLNSELETLTLQSSNMHPVCNFAMDQVKVKIDSTGSKSKKYVCCIGGYNVHFKTTQQISMICHLRTNHPEIWNGYCDICKEFVMPQGLHNFVHCFKHMLNNHLDNFPELDHVDANKEMEPRLPSISEPLLNSDSTEKVIPEAEGLIGVKERIIIKKQFKTAKINSTCIDNPQQLAKSTDKSNSLNILLKSGKDGSQCINSEATETHIGTKTTFESTSKDENIIAKEKFIQSAPSKLLFDEALIKKETCMPDKYHYYKYEEQQASVMKAKHSSVFDSMLSEQKLVQIYKCAGRFCAYTTNIPDYAKLHAITHKKASKTDESFLMCTYCDFDCKGDVDSLVKHVFKSHGHCKYVCSQCFYRAAASRLVLAHMQRIHKTQNDILEIATPIYDIAEESLPQDFEIMGYFCANKDTSNPECRRPYFTQGSFVEHLQNHGPPYSCFICAHSESQPRELLLHLSDHGLKQFHCTWCSVGANSKEIFLAHFSTRHPTRKPQAYTRNVTGVQEGKTQTMVLPLVDLNEPSVATKLITNEEDSNKESEYAVRAADKAHTLEELVTGMCDSESVSGVLSSEETLIHPLSTPIAVHSNNLFSPTADANATSKHTQNTDSEAMLKQTLKRRLSQNIISASIQKRVCYDAPMPDMDIRNAKETENSPSELHSLETTLQYPKYVPYRERYICGAKDCVYHSIDKDMLKYHWETLHNLTNFKCAHCQYLVTCVPITWAKIEEHLNMHGSILYVCTICEYYHYQFKILEEHMTELHKGTGQIRSVRDQVNTPAGDVAVATTCTMPWKCNCCNYRTDKKCKIVKHCRTRHSTPLQFKCTECAYSGSSETNIKKHKLESHELDNEDVDYFYYYDDGKTVAKLPEKYIETNKRRKSNSSQNNAYVGGGQPELRIGMKIRVSDSVNGNQKRQISDSLQTNMAPSVRAPRHASAFRTQELAILETLKSETELKITQMFSNSDPSGSSVQSITSNKVTACSPEPSCCNFKYQEKVTMSKETNNVNRSTSLASVEGSSISVQQVNSYDTNSLTGQLEWKCPHLYCSFSTTHPMETYGHLRSHIT